MRIETSFTQLLGCDLPIVVAPMFLVSNIAMVVAASQAGAIGSFPALNVRPVEKLREWLMEIRQRTTKPYAVNLIVNRSNIYLSQQLEICLAERVPMIIASLGNPEDVIRQAHAVGTKVFCDVVQEEHAKKAVNAGVDGLIAVASGAGGHAGNISASVLVPYLARQFPNVPVLAAGGIANGASLAASLAYGASGVSMGTRFIASTECQVGDDYKQAIVQSGPEDIVTTYKLDGVAANVIATPYIKKQGTQLTWLERLLWHNRKIRSWIMGYRSLSSLPLLQKAAEKPTWKQVWGAGQTVGLIDDVIPIPEILDRMVKEYAQAVRNLPEVKE